MKWSAFPTCAMAFDPQILSDLDEERDLKWQIDEYFSYPKKENGEMSPRLREIVGNGVTLPVYKILDHSLSIQNISAQKNSEKKEIKDNNLASGDFEFRCKSLSLSQTNLLIGDIVGMWRRFEKVLKCPLALCRIFHGLFFVSESLLNFSDYLYQ